MKTQHWILAAVVFILIAIVFQLGFSWGQFRADHNQLQSNFDRHWSETDHRLASLEAERNAREQRIAWFRRTLTFAKKLPFLKWTSEYV